MSIYYYNSRQKPTINALFCTSHFFKNVYDCLSTLSLIFVQSFSQVLFLLNSRNNFPYMTLNVLTSRDGLLQTIYIYISVQGTTFLQYSTVDYSHEDIYINVEWNVN